MSWMEYGNGRKAQRNQFKTQLFNYSFDIYIEYFKLFKLICKVIKIEF